MATIQNYILPYMEYTLGERLELATLVDIRAKTVTDFLVNKTRLRRAETHGAPQEEIDVLLNRGYELLDTIAEIDACYAQCFIDRGGMN